MALSNDAVFTILSILQVTCNFQAYSHLKACVCTKKIQEQRGLFHGIRQENAAKLFNTCHRK